MQKQYHIKWRKSDHEKINKAVRNFNRKITRTAKNHPDIAAALPAKVTKKELTELINTRADFNRIVNSLTRFTKDKKATEIVKNEKGVTVTKWAYKEAKLMMRLVNQKRERQKKELGVPEKKEMQPATLKQSELSGKEFNFDSKKSRKEWNLFVIGLEKELARNTLQTAEKYKENYLKAIDTALGESGAELKKLVEGLDPIFMYRNYWGNDEILKIQFVSDPQPAESIAELMLEHWQSKLAEENAKKE